VVVGCLFTEIDFCFSYRSRRYEDPGNIGGLYAILGDKDQAFAWLEKAYADKSVTVTNIKTEHAMDRLRSDPRYIDLVKRMGLPQ
jgi:hypothetical protein